jgi:hypothetical protein
MALIRRGFNQAQIAAWDRGGEFELFISEWWCCVLGGGLQAYDQKWVAALERRRTELKTVEVTNGGIWQAPAVAPPGGPGQAYSAPQAIPQYFGPPIGGCYSGGYYGYESDPYYGDW